MAAGDYVRSAASQLHQAVGDLQNQISTIQHDADNHKRDMDNTITDHERTKTELRAKQQLGSDDPGSMRTLEMMIFEHGKQVDQLKQQINDHNSLVSNQIQSKTQAMNNLNSLASQLDSLAGSVDN